MNEIDNPVLLSFCDETIRPTADKLAGMLLFASTALNAAIGKGVPATLGTDVTTLTRAEPWADADYGAIPIANITNSNSSGRTLLNNYDIIALLRVLVTLNQLVTANPSLQPLVGKIAVNPRV